MHPKLHSIATSLLLATQAQAFRVTFYLGSQCRGARLGTGSYSYPGYPNACHNVPPNAISATIEPEYLDGESNSEFHPLSRSSRLAWPYKKRHRERGRG